MGVRTIILSQFGQVASEQKRELAALDDDLPLAECGLDSLSMAIVVTRLEDALGVDPFSGDEDVPFPTTFGEFVRVYEVAAK